MARRDKDLTKAEKEDILEDIGARVLKIARGFETDHENIRDHHLQLTTKGQYYFRGHQRLYYDAVARDYRAPYESPAYDPNTDEDENRVINIYRAHGEAIIAALTIELPGVNFLPDDAKNPNDLDTAENYSNAALLIQRHINAQVEYAHAVYLAWISPLVACYHYLKEDEAYGLVEEETTNEEVETEYHWVCKACDTEVTEADEVCPNCASDNIEEVAEEKTVFRKSKKFTPKSRICVEMLDASYVSVSPYAKTIKQSPYLTYKFEEHVSSARARHEDIEIQPSQDQNAFERFARDPAMFQGESNMMVTTMCVWLRPEAYFYESSEIGKVLKEKYPKGMYAEFIDDKLVSMREERLDDFWTVWRAPTSSHIHMNPIGQPVFDPQEVENDIINLSVETMKQSIPQTFADPVVVDFAKYEQTPLRPGALYQAKKPANSGLGDGFYTTRTASMSQEIDKFESKIDQKAQFVVGSYPSIYGGTMQGGSKTYAEYTASGQKALQRLSLINKSATTFYAEIMSKVVPLYVNALMEDERYTYESAPGEYTNLSIVKDTGEGKVGHVEPSSSGSLPVTWGQQRDLVMQLIQMNNDNINAVLFSPDNSHLLRKLSGISELKIPGDDARMKQFREILQLISTEPADDGMGNFTPSVEVDIEIDDHIVEAQVLKSFMISKSGQDLKQLKPEAYANLLAHYNQHMNAGKSQMMGGQVPPEGQEPLPEQMSGVPENG